MTAEKYAILFYEFNVFTIDGIRQRDAHRYEIKSLVLTSEIARRLGVKTTDVYKVLKKWGEAGHPQTYFMPMDSKEKARGGRYDTGLHIWNFQGGHEGDKGKPNEMGVLTFARSWGKGFQTIDTKRTEFYLFPISMGVGQ